jgi:iron complex transport system ATP-binding protein
MNVEHLSGGYGDGNVIKDVSFRINRGDFLGIIGPNGSGKSTLLRLMSRVLNPREGKVTLQGSDILNIDLKKLSQKTAFVPQETLVAFSFTVQEIVLLGRIPHLGRLQHEGKKDHAIVASAMMLTDTLECKNKYIDELSAGERQRVLIARALAQEPILLFLDEPTSHLDIGHQVHMLDLLKKLNKEEGLSLCVVLHDLNLASEYCDRILLLQEGRVFKEGTPWDVLTYQNIETVYQTLVVVKENPISSKPYCILTTNIRVSQGNPGETPGAVAQR